MINEYESATSPTTRPALVDSAEALIPQLQGVATEAERLGRLPEATVEALEAAGLTRTAAPRDRGGAQLAASERIRVMELLARGCGSTSFVTMIYGGLPYVLTKFTDEAQDEVYASENPKLCGFLIPSAQATRTRGGYRLSGAWPFATGQHHAGWVSCAALVMNRDGPPEMALFLVPRAEFAVADDWHVSGLCATGSNTLSVEDVLVPEHRMLPLRELDSGLSDRYAGDPYFKTPVIPFFLAEAFGTPLGLAAAAVAIFERQIHNRGIAYTHYTRQADATVTHLQMDEVTMKLDHARFHAARGAQTSETLEGSETDTRVRVRTRGDLAWCMRLCREVVQIVQEASGASALSLDHPLQRIVRDMRALSLHGMFVFSAGAELHGRMLCGLDPNSDAY
jgi:alkylation response protein AidB-like acyl-CoA dehydrogenase